MFRSVMMLSVACLFGGAAQAETVAFSATLNGASGAPAKTADGKGTVSGSLDTATKMPMMSTLTHF